MESGEGPKEQPVSVEVEVGDEVDSGNKDTTAVHDLETGRQAAAGGGVGEGGASASEAVEPAVVSQGLKLMMNQKVVHWFSYAHFPGMQHTSPVGWMLIETEDIEGESIRCHPLQGNEVLTELFERYRSSDCKAVVLINTSDDYKLAPDLIAGVGKPCLPVIVLKKRDGETALRCLEDASEVSIDVHAKIDVETDVDGGRTKLAVQETRQHHSSPQTTPKKQPPPESSLSAIQKMKVKMGFQSKPASDLKLDIKKLMFTSDKTPLVVVEDQGRFSMIMAAMHNYERVAKRDNNHSDLNDVIKKLRIHMDSLFAVDLPFYIFLIYRMHKKYNYYVCDEMRAMIIAVIDRVESEDRRAVIVQAMTTFIARGDFKIMYNADKTEDRQVPFFHQLEQACMDLADTSYKLQIPSIENVGDLPNGMKPVYKNFVYSRMLWISLAMMLRERRSVQPTRKVLEVWATKFVSYHQRVEVTSETLRELEVGLEVGQLLKLPSIYSLSVPQLTDFIASSNDRTLRPFVQIMECFRRLKRFLVVPTEVVVMLSSLRSVYGEYLTPPVVSYKMKSVSCEGTLSGCISEGIEFLDMVLEWLGELEMNKEVKDSELESWLKLLLRLVDITGDNPAQYLKHFIKGREKVVKTYRTLAVNHIVAATQKGFGKLSIQQFCLLYKAFKIYSKNVVEEFLRSYSIPATVTLSDPTWKEFFGAAVVRSQSAHSHQYLAEFMMACSMKYKESGRAVAFITDLLKLDVEKLLSVSGEEDKDSVEVRAKFSLFLKDFINRNALIHGILDQMVIILVSMNNKQNEFQRLVLDVLRREVVPDLRTLQGKGQKNNFKNLMKEVVRILKNDLSWLSSMSPRQHFCWGILGTCVAKIAINKDTFDWVHNYSDIISGFEVGVVYSCYCTDKKLSVEERVIIEGLPAAVKAYPSEDLRKYFEWIGAVQGVLQHWKKKFQHHDVTYDEVINYASSHVKVLPLGESVSTPNLVVESALIGNAKTTFLENFELLNVHLLKYIPSQSDGKWCMLPPLLETYGVALPQATQDFIVKKVAFPKETLIPQDQLGTPLHPSTSGTFKPGVEISLCLHKTVTLRELSKVLRELEAFQQPLLDHLEMLVFFKLHKSSLFDKYLRFFLKKIAEELQEPQELVSRLPFKDIPFSIAMSPGSFIPPPSLARSTTHTQPRDNLVRGLGNTQKLIRKIMLGTATYSEIVAEDESMLKGLDIENEFAILHEYGQYNHLTEATCAGLDGVRNMLELFQYTTHVKNIRSVCDQYATLKGCRDDPKLKELCDIMEDHVLSEDRSQLTPLEAKKKMTQVKQILCLGEHTSSKCLEIFAAMADSAAFYQFVRDKQFYGQQGQAIFRQQYELITAQLQHEEYDESVLNHLLVAFKIITPFMDPGKDLTDLMKEVTALNATHGFKQLNTVNTNITLIRLWFSRAEGDTLENVAKELESIMESGSFAFHLEVDPGVESGEDLGGTVKGQLYLEYEPFYAASDEAVTGSLGGQRKERKERKNAEQINDFVRKLGFMDTEKEGGDSIKQFLHLSQTAYKLLELYQKLKDLGHPLYLRTDSVATIPCSTAKQEVDALVQRTQQLLGMWTQEVADLRTRYRWLLYLNMPKLLQLSQLLCTQAPAEEAMVDNIVHEVSFLAHNSVLERKKLRAGVEVALRRVGLEVSQESPMLVVGQFLDNLLSGHALPQHSPMSARETISFPRHRATTKISNQPLFFCPSYSHASRICFILEIFSCIPEAYQVLRCQATTSEEELELFLKRAQTQANHYLVLDVNKLPFKLQEQLVQLHLAMQSEDHMMLDMSVQPLCSSTISFVETSPSMLREMPWISFKETKEPRVTMEEAKKMCKSAAGNLACAQLVYGAAGDGKTHYIKKQLSLCPSHKTIAINEAFTPSKAISKLRSLPLYEKNVGIFFNFTILPPGDSVADVERERYRELMDIIAWFFFDLLVLGYVEDPDTGLSFRIPGGLEWAVYVEVPSRHTDVTAGEALKLLYREVPALYLIGTPHYILPDTPFTVDGDVQLVCKYLQAYNLKDSKQRGIDRIYNERAPVKFSTDPDLAEEVCHMLLRQYMPKHIASCKITQQLFIRYMTRRCNFLDTLPAFNYNIGRGELVTREYGMQSYTDTSKLGSTLLSTMLKEVNDFCDPTIKENWSVKPHQQLIYDFKDGGSSLGLISLHPDRLNEADTAKFKKIGVNVPSMTEVYSRDVLDSFLSRALNVELENKRLSIVDDSAYVLTLDYTIKMLNIHERHECGIPVIIEGETGVGKTALVEMLSKLWNQSLLLEWTKQKGRLSDFFHKKLGDFPGEVVPDNYQACVQAVEAISMNEATEEALLLLCNYIDGSHGKLYLQVLRYLCPMRNDPVLPLLTFDDPNIDSLDKLFEMVEGEKTPEMTARLLHAILRAQVKSSFYKINVHAAMTPAEIKKQFAPVVKQAELLQETYKQVMERVASTSSVASVASRRESAGSSIMRGGFVAVGAASDTSLDESLTVVPSRTPFVTVFLDEVNTSSCLGLFKEIIVDRTIDGETIPSNVFIVAACNPHRGNSLASHKSAWLRGTYYVRSLHPTLKLLMWDYGSLDENQERDYINAKMKMINKDMANPEIASLADLIVTSQKMMREFAFRQLKDGLKTKTAQSLDTAHVSSRSCVSQRDIQRVFTFYQWFRSMYSKDPKYKDRPDNHRRAMLVSLGVVYYMRLNAEFRKEYSKFLNEINRLPNEVSFSKAFMDELDYFVGKVDLPKGIARTLALKENTFATIVCAVTHTPLIIVGAPGSSKTLSFNQTIANLKGQESKHSFFRNTDIFRSLDPHYYQCSRRTTSNEIQIVFSRAINRQRSHERFKLPIYCVVFMDEAGLPEESHESLKVLHYHLDKQEVSFVAITNHVLDAAKTNRAISLFRPEASDEDLETLAKGCLCSNPDEPPPEMESDLKTVVKFCQPYIDCMKNSKFSKFFGLRDFIQFINYLRRKKDESQAILSSQLVMQALERNFNGSEEFESICKAFLRAIGAHLEDMTQRGILEVLQDSMQDRPQAMQDLTENEVRYKLIIDPSEDDSLVRSLFTMGLLRRENTRMFVCSDFPGDGQLQKIDTIAAIRHSAIEGHTVVMSQTDDIHESFYDLFNQRFRRIDDPEHGPRYYTNIAIGAHLKPSRVHPNFQCVVVVKKSEVENTPAPFLNRFEKYLISHGSLLDMMLQKLPPCLAIMVRAAKDKVLGFMSSVYNSTSLYGMQPETLDSLILDFLPPLDHTYTKLGDDSIVDTSQPPDIYLLQELLGALRSNAGFHIPRYPMMELEADAAHLFQLIQCDPKYEGLLQTMTHEVAMQAVADALNLLYSAPGPQGEGGQLDLTPEGCLVVSLLQQLLVRLLMKRMMQLMTTEAIVLYRNNIPYSYLNHYLSFQAHFSLRDLISSYHSAYSATKVDFAKSPNKLVVYSRSSTVVHSLPAQFMCQTQDNTRHDVGVACAKELVFEETDKLMVQKLSSLLSQSSVQEMLRDFVSSEKAEVLLLVANMQDTSIKTINHIRVMIEEVELQAPQRQNQPPKLFVLLLHFPPALFFKHCYPALFLKGWDHTYLDTVTHSSSGGVVDIQDWFQRCCFPSSPHEEGSGVSAEPDPLITAARHLLPQAIPVLSAQMYFGNKQDRSFNSSMNATQRGQALDRMLNHCGLGDVLCKKFCSYWKPKVMLEYLERAATFSKQRESTLNITDSIQTQFKTLFLDFCVYMLTRANENYNLDVVYAEEKPSPVRSLFLDIFKQFPIPKLSQLGVLSTSLPTPKPHSRQSHFPFFWYVCDLMEKHVESSGEVANQKLNVLMERENRGLASISAAILSPDSDPQKKLEFLTSAVVKVLEPLVDAAHREVLGLVLSSMYAHFDLWKRYFNDFVCSKLNLDPPSDMAGPALPKGDIAQRLLHTYFGHLHEQDPPHRLASLHCYIRVYQLQLAQMATLLRPLSKIKELQSGPNLLSPSASNNLNLATVSAQSSATEEQLVQAASQGYLLGHPVHLINFVITTLFEALVNAVYSTNQQEQLDIWFTTYRDMMVLSTMKQYIYVYVGVAELKCVSVKLHVMQATFLTARSCPAVNQEALLMATQTFQTLFQRHFTENTELRPNREHAHLGEVVEVVVEVLSPNQSCQASLQLYLRPIQAALEGLLLHYFSPFQGIHCYEDMMWFLSLANRQVQWCARQPQDMESVYEESVGVVAGGLDDDLLEQSVVRESAQIPGGAMDLSRFKYHLSCILGCYKEMGSGEGDQLQSGPLLMYRQEVRTLVGRVLCPHDNQLGHPGPYIPVFYQNSPPITAGRHAKNKLMQQPLCHLYFMTVLEHLMAKQNSESFLHHQHSHMASLVRMASSIRTSLETAVGGEAVLLWVELQAVTQVLLQQLAQHLDPNQTQKLGDVQQIMDDVNRLLDDAELDCALSHGMVLSLHLLQLLKSSRRFTDLLTSKFDSLKIIKCLQPIHAEFQATAEPKPHLFPFLQPGAEGKLTALYSEVSKTMKGIHRGEAEVEELVTIAQNCYGAVSDTGRDVHLSFRMVLWLVTYYEFFDKNVVSALLCNVMGGQELAEYLREDGYIRLLQCFLNPALMVQRREPPNALTEQQVLQLGPDGRPRIVHKEGQLVDPIYLLFMPGEPEKLDQSDIDLQHALANLVGVVLGSPTSSNHLWYHLFAADKLENTYMTGFMYNSVIKRDGLQYDCGVELSPEGQFGRQDYKQQACRGTYTLHSLYLLLWANFGAFCMSLLTQPDSDARIHGVVISEWLSLRHYCLSQLKTLWIHIRNNMGLSEEQRAFYVAQALYKLREVLVQPRTVPSDMKEGGIVTDTLRGVFETRAQLDAYEKMWHTCVYQPTWDQQSEKFIELCNRQQSIFFTYLRRLEVHYPHFPSEQEFTHGILSAGDLQQHSAGGKLCLLAKFSMEWRRLQRGGLLLPDLVELYQWLHTNLSHLITYNRAANVTIGHIMTLAKQNSSKDYGNYLWELYKRVEHHYNTYVDLIGGAIGAGACAAVRRGNKIFTIADDIPLLHFLTDVEEEGQGNDWLYVVMADIIANHNQTIENLYSSIQTHPLARLLPDEPPKVHPTEVSGSTAIVGQFQEQHGVNNFLQLLRSRYQPSPAQAQAMPAGSSLVSMTCRTSSTLQVKQQEPMFVIDRLEEDIVDVFITGKPLISSENQLRTVFKFKKEADNKAGASTDVAITALDVQSLGEGLPDDFKFPLTEPLLKRFEYEFHSASYHLMNEVVMALRTVIGHLTKALHEVQNTDHEELKEQLVPEFMLNLYEHLKGHSAVLQEVGVHSAQPSHLQCLADLPLMSAYDCLKLFFGWVEDGYYDFSALPFPFKVHMSYQDKHLMDQQLRLRWLGSVSDLKEELQDLITVLKHSEQDITSRVKEATSKPILDYLMEYRMLDEEDNRISRYLSRTILLQHYVAFRLALRKLLLRLHQELQGKEDGQDGSDVWLEFESSLWTRHLPHLREEIYGDSQFVFDPSTECYGFQEDKEESEGSGGFVAALLQDESFTLDLDDPSNEERSEMEDAVRPDSLVQPSRGEGGARGEGGVEGGAGSTDEELVARLRNDPKLQQQLLSIVQKECEKEDEELHTVGAHFSLFLKDLIHQNTPTCDLLDPITSFLMSMTNKQNEFQRLVLDVLRFEVVPDLRTLQSKRLKNNFKNLMKEVVKILKNDLSWLSSMSPKQHFCWGILGMCVAKIVINKDVFDWVHNYSDVISDFELGVVYCCFCINKKLSMEEQVIIEDLPAAVKIHPSEDLRKYFEWIGAVQGVLQHWKKKFQHHDVTYDEVINYAGSHMKVLPLGESVSTPNLVVESALLGSTKTTFLDNFELLNVYLLRYIPNQADGKYCMLPPLLETYGVVLPQATQDFIVKKVAFPKETLIPQDQLGTPLHPSNSGLFKPGVEISLCLHKTMTLRELSKVLRELETFQQPLLDHLEMLVFFKLHKSSLFDKYLRFFLKESAKDLPLDSVTLSLSLTTENAKIQARDNLAKSLVRTNALINQIILGTVTYSQILPVGESMLKELNITEEFDILRKYGQYYVTGVTYDGLDGVKEMLEYVRYTTHINNIRSVCTIILRDCSDNPDFRELCSSMDDDVWEEDHSQLTPLEAKEKMKLVKETKLVKEYLHSENCPEIFASLADVMGNKSFILSIVTMMNKLVSNIQGKYSCIQQCLADKQAEVDKLTRCIHEKDAHIQQCLSGKQIEIDTLSRQIQEKDAYIQQCLADKQAEVEELTRCIHEKDAHIQQCLSDKDTLSRQIQEKDAYMQHFIAEKETERKQLSSSIHERDMYIQQIIKDKKS